MVDSDVIEQIYNRYLGLAQYIVEGYESNEDDETEDGEEF